MVIGLDSFTLPKFNIDPENRPSQKERIVFQPFLFRGYVSFSEGPGFAAKLEAELWISCGGRGE